MSEQLFDAPPVKAGYYWSVRLEVAGVTFPSGSAYKADIKKRRSDETAIASLTTANGGLVRVSDTELDIVLAGTVTAGWEAGEVIGDIVRTDTNPDQHLSIEFALPVTVPLTRAV